MKKIELEKTLRSIILAIPYANISKMDKVLNEGRELNLQQIDKGFREMLDPKVKKYIDDDVEMIMSKGIIAAYDAREQNKYTRDLKKNKSDFLQSTIILEKLRKKSMQKIKEGNFEEFEKEILKIIERY